MLPRTSACLFSGLLFASAWTHTCAAEAPQKALPVTAAVALKLVESGALLTEDFEAPEMNAKLWWRRHSNPDRTTFHQQGGRLDLAASGIVHMNGFWGMGGVKHKDLVLVGEMDVRSSGSPPHRLALHLCGGDGVRSPDHWVEILMVDLGATARFLVGASLLVGVKSPRSFSLELPHPPGRGFLGRIELNGSTGIA